MPWHVCPRRPVCRTGLVGIRAAQNRLHLHWVRPDVPLVADSVRAIPLHDEYTDTPEYMALLRGALHLMKQSRIDLQVVGLPVALLHLKKAALEKAMMGARDVGGGKTVTVVKALAVAQPQGDVLRLIAAEITKDIGSPCHDLGAFLFKKAVKAAFPSHKIHEVKGPLFANVLGFQLAGQNRARTVMAAPRADRPRLYDDLIQFPWPFGSPMRPRVN